MDGVLMPEDTEENNIPENSDTETPDKTIAVALRHEAFRSFALKRMYPEEYKSVDSCDDSCRENKNPGTEPRVKTVSDMPDESSNVTRVYGVSPAPAGYQLPLHLQSTQKAQEDDQRSSSSSDESLDEQDTYSRKRRRRRRKIQQTAEPQSVEGDSQQGEKTGTDSSRDQTQPALTKNQKRKLKKKRHKEKLRQAKSDGGISSQSKEFVYKAGVDHDEELECNAEAWENVADKGQPIKGLVEFLHAVWDVYYRKAKHDQTHAELEKQSKTLAALEEAFSNCNSSMQDIDGLLRIKSLILLNNGSAARQAIMELTHSSVCSESVELMTKLFTFWLDEIAAK